MKKLSLPTVLFALLVLFIAVSCGEKSEQYMNNSTHAEYVPPSKEVEAKKETPKTLTPVKVGVSVPKEDKTEHPNCDGGECANYDFTVGFQIADLPNTLQVDYKASAYSIEKNGTKSAPEIVQAKNAYSALEKADPNDLEITIEDGKVVKILLKEKWADGNKFEPAQVLWQKTSFN